MTTSRMRLRSSLKVTKSMPLMWLSWNVGLCGRPALSVVSCRLVPWHCQCTNTCTGSHTPTCLAGCRAGHAARQGVNRHHAAAASWIVAARSARTGRAAPCTRSPPAAHLPDFVGQVGVGLPHLLHKAGKRLGADDGPVGHPHRVLHTRVRARACARARAGGGGCVCVGVCVCVCVCVCVRACV
jgi:hypothetical protein